MDNRERFMDIIKEFVSMPDIKYYKDGEREVLFVEHTHRKKSGGSSNFFLPNIRRKQVSNRNCQVIPRPDGEGDDEDEEY